MTETPRYAEESMWKLCFDCILAHFNHDSIGRFLKMKQCFLLMNILYDIVSILSLCLSFLSFSFAVNVCFLPELFNFDRHENGVRLFQPVRLSTYIAHPIV